MISVIVRWIRNSVNPAAMKDRAAAAAAAAASGIAAVRCSCESGASISALLGQWFDLTRNRLAIEDRERWAEFLGRVSERAQLEAPSLYFRKS